MSGLRRPTAAVAIGYVALSQPKIDPAASSYPEYRRQRPAMLRLARSKGLRLKEVPVDGFAVQAPRLCRRPQLVQAVGLARYWRAAALIVSNLQALQLSETELAVFVRGLEKWSISVLEASPLATAPGDYLVWSHELLETDPAAARHAGREFAEFAKATCRASTGTKAGRKPFGVNADEQLVLHRIWALRKKPKRGPRMSYGKIAKQLNKEELKPRKALMWSARTVQVLIRRTRPHLDD